MTGFVYIIVIGSVVAGLASTAIAFLSMRVVIRRLTDQVRDSHNFLLSCAMATDAYTRNRLAAQLGIQLSAEQKAQITEQLVGGSQQTKTPPARKSGLRMTIGGETSGPSFWQVDTKETREVAV